MTDWSPEKEDKDNPRHLIQDMVDAFGRIEQGKADRHAAMYGTPEQLHPGFQVYCLAYEAAWRVSIKHYGQGISAQSPFRNFEEIDRVRAIDIHRIALLAAENFAPPELEQEETEQ